MKTFSIVTILSLAVLLSGGQTCLAQQQGNGGSIFQDQPLSLESVSDRRIAAARQIMQVRNFQAAADMLETVLETEPNNAIVQNLLRTCYDQLKQYEKAELLARKMVERAPQSMSYRLYLAETLARMGNKNESETSYRETVDLIGESQPEQRQTMVLRSLISVAMEDLALRYIDEFRALNQDSTQFAIELGTVLEGRREYEEAADEYLKVLDKDSSDVGSQAEKKLLALLDFPESAGIVEKLLLSSADSTVGVRTLRLLSGHYIRSGQFDKALAFSLRQDSLEGGNGNHLIRYLRQCQDRMLWSQLLKASEYILENYDSSRVRTEAYFQYASALANTERPEEAIVAYDSLFASTSNDRIRADALYGIGVIKSEYLNRPAEALVYYDSVISHYPRGLSFINSSRMIPLCYLRAGNLKKADEEFARMGTKNTNEDLQEETAYFLGLISFFNKEYDSSKIQMQKLLVDFPRGYYVNDALRLLVLVDEAAGDSTLLYDYSNAIMFEERRMPDSTRAWLQKVVDAPNPALADVALYHLAELELRQPNEQAAMSLLDRLIEQYADSYFAPYGMKSKADLILSQGKDKEEAMQLYRQLLENYSDYPFITEVRKKLRELQPEPPIG